MGRKAWAQKESPARLDGAGLPKIVLQSRLTGVQFKKRAETLIRQGFNAVDFAASGHASPLLTRRNA